FIDAKYDTHFVPDHFDPVKMQDTSKNEEVAALAASLLKGVDNDAAPKTVVSSNGTSESMWWKTRRE
ncbi:MAG TPA: hypothetical protein VJ941_05285, partial [Gracilimonas sp.]|nr:hypothetical protein [Gracilimonas sp.]